MGGSVLLSWLFDLRGMGITTIADLAPVPAGLPTWTMPSLDPQQLWALVPLAAATTVLSLVECSAVARSIAAQTGQRVDMNREFMAQGMGNLSASACGGYPISGSLARSAINQQSGASSRWPGILAGLWMLGVLMVLGPVFDLTPVAALAGLLLVVASDLIDRPAIRQVMHSLWGDRLAFVGTVVGTWLLPLDAAIYLGVGISVALFLWRVRHLRVRELVWADGRSKRWKRATPPPAFIASAPCTSRATCSSARPMNSKMPWTTRCVTPMSRCSSFGSSAPAAWTTRPPACSSPRGTAW